MVSMAAADTNERFLRPAHLGAFENTRADATLLLDDATLVEVMAGETTIMKANPVPPCLSVLLLLVIGCARVRVFKPSLYIYARVSVRECQTAASVGSGRSSCSSLSTFYTLSTLISRP